MSRVSALLLAVLVLALAAGCGSGGGVGSGVAAQVGDVEITKARLDELMNQARLVYRKTNRPFPKDDSKAFTDLRGRALAYLVVGAMYEAKATAEDIVASESEVAAEVAKTKRATYGKTPAEQAKAMKNEGMSEEELAAESRLKVVQRKVETKVWAGVTVTDADVKAFYEENIGRFTIPAARVIRTILVQDEKLAKRLRDLLLGGSDFATLARKYSVDQPTAKLGGRVAISKGQTSPAFDKVAFSIATGKISDIIVTQYGYQILQAVAPVQPQQITPLSEVKGTIRRQLLQTKREEALGKWQLEAKKEYCGGKIEYAGGYTPRAEDNPCRASGLEKTPSGSQ